VGIVVVEVIYSGSEIGVGVECVRTATIVYGAIFGIHLSVRGNMYETCFLK
jgi:hypothetical protein